MTSIRTIAWSVFLFLVGPGRVLGEHVAGHVVDKPPCIPEAGKICNPIRYGTIDEFLLAILAVVIQMGLLVVVFFLVFAGFQFVTAQGNTEKLQKAKTMFVWVVVGAFVLLGVYVIRAAICGTLGQLGVSITCEV